MNYLYLLTFNETMEKIDETLHNIIDPVSSSPIFWAAFFLGGIVLFVTVFDSIHKGGK